MADWYVFIQGRFVCSRSSWVIHESHRKILCAIIIYRFCYLFTCPVALVEVQEVGGVVVVVLSDCAAEVLPVDDVDVDGALLESGPREGVLG